MTVNREKEDMRRAPQTAAIRAIGEAAPALAETKRADSAIDVESLDAEGRFEGYAAIFNRLDRGRDIIAPGAFQASLARKGAATIKLLWQHDPAEPIGVFETIRETVQGLHVAGRLLLGVARAREAFQLMRAGALDGLSIGYRAEESRRDEKTGVRTLLAIDLWEISLVTFPMQEAARIERVKSQPFQTIRQFEAFLRDAGGFSRAEAKAVAARGFRASARRDADADLALLLESLERARQTLTSIPDNERTP